MRKVREILNDIINIGASEGKKTIFMIANTAKIEEMEFYTIPIRNFSHAVVSGVVVFSEEVANRVASQIDGKVDYVFVDAEKKIPGKCSEPKVMANIERAVKTAIKESVFISYKANDLTVDAADAFISEYYSNSISGVGGRNIAIIGAGNIGSKLAIKLVERGAEVRLFRRDMSKLKLVVDCINVTKSNYTIAKAHVSKSVSEAYKDADVIIGTTNGIPVIDETVVNYISSQTLLIDIGKGSISQSAVGKVEELDISIYRLGVESALEGLILSLLATHKTFVEKTGRRRYCDIDIVSGGLVARKGEIVVDDFSNPRYIYGIGNGHGDFDRTPNDSSREAIRSLEKLIGLQ